MIGFLLLAGALLALGIGVLLWPLLRSAGPAPAAKADAIVELFREKLRDLEAERKSGVLQDAQYEQSRRDLERQLLDAVAATDVPLAAGPRRARWSAALIGVFLLLAPVVLYVNLGAPGALEPGAIRAPGAPGAANASDADGQGEANAGTGKGKAGPLTGTQVQKMIDGLVDALKRNPGDAQAWNMLARAYSYQHQYPEAVRAYVKAVALTPKDARLLSDMADAMAMANGQRLDGEPLKLIERALQIDPNEIKALALAGTAAFDHQEYVKAIGYWERALKAAPGDAEFARSLRGSLEEARQLAGVKGGEGGAGVAPIAQSSAVAAAAPVAAPAVAGAAGAAVRGKISLSASLVAKAQPGDTIFVFARAAQGPKVPLAMLRRQVKDLPFEFSLDDSMAMMPEYTLSKYAPVIVGARVSRSGDAIAAAGDLQGFSKPVSAGATGVNVTIDQVVP
jgi:cytochrome c-type biogenesis protein CcmH